MNTPQKICGVLIVFPLMMLGFGLGVLWGSIYIGIAGGIRAVENLGDQCDQDNEARKR